MSEHFTYEDEEREEEEDIARAEVFRRLQILDRKLNHIWDVLTYAGALLIFFGTASFFKAYTSEPFPFLGGLLCAAMTWWMLNREFPRADQ